MRNNIGEPNYIIYRVGVFLPSEEANNEGQNHIAVCDFLLLCASVDNIYDIVGGKQYGRKTLHYIQDGHIPSFRGSK